MNEQQRQQQERIHKEWEERMANWPRFKLADISCRAADLDQPSPPTPAEIRAAGQRWIERCYTTRTMNAEFPDECNHQCLHCHFYAAIEGSCDWGICWNPKSPHDGKLVFEHGGCEEHSELLKYPSH